MNLGLIRSTLVAFVFASLSLSASAQTLKFITNQGEFEMELKAEAAPKTVANFLRYVEDGSFKGTLFHRTISNFMVQGGGYSINYEKVDTYRPVENESKTGLSNKRGTIAMARTNDPHSATRQFFINVNDNSYLDGSANKFGYTVFAEITSGMDVVDRIANKPTKTGPIPGMRNVPMEKVIIEDVLIVDESQP
ncbi:peptidylprolyl isomerase [Agarivorans aestuarii]|uniref:Peptidyl-prolyl cis-trans isomerase n=1 Tax=Agarivorans aestuarii TaxID=1563703 RepID=A0ABU7G3B3_9ALTE|nr:peptidylprolyl isomerase [Agarivorans aestuarii]MEE1673882.1 peptidylprolyl isomerase [Agarivorans aestuarii]